MQRRSFLSLGSAGLLGAIALGRSPLRAEPASRAPGGIAWQRDGQSGLFRQVAVDGQPLVRGQGAELLEGFCRRSAGRVGEPETALSAAKPSGACGPLRLTLMHRLLVSGGSQEDLLEASLALHNPSDRPETVEVGFVTAARPCEQAADQQLYLPISAGGLLREARLAELGGQGWLQDCRQAVGAKGFRCHYFEPSASDPRRSATPALLLAPVVDLFHPEQTWRVGLFTTSLQPACFEMAAPSAGGAWRMGHVLRLEPGQQRTVRGYLHVHRGDAAAAWAAFHRFGHHEDQAPVAWLHDVRVHYYDFLSAATAKGRRGDGYEADLPSFGEFHVGLATQHGYCPAIGDYLHPDRPRWQAMVSDPAGAAAMSLDKMKGRIAATRRAGVHSAVYMHMSLLDEGTPLFEPLRDSIVVGPDGQPIGFGWQGPDTVKRTWKMSVASPAWRDHLLQQARWIMELLDPDAIVMDETFAALGYDHHLRREGPLSPGGIELMQKLRALVRSFGPQKAFLTSDCSMSNMVLWSDGDAGDHGYAGLLGHPLYQQSPMRYLAALGAKPWLPCAWAFQKFWSKQMELARSTGAGLGVSNGWIEFTGLARLPPPVRQQMIRDIESLQRP